MTDPPALQHPEVGTILGWRQTVARWLAVEAALARANAELGIVDRDAAAAVTDACDVDRFDLETLAADAAASATPIIPLVRALSDVVPPGAQGAVHVGATSQDILDTGTSLAAREVVGVILDDLVAAARRCAELAEAERDTVIVGRTLLQHAVPITFGLKAARWLTALGGHVGPLRSLPFLVQLGGAAGTLAPFGDRGPEIVGRVASELHLGVPVVPWHAEREPLHAIVAACALLAGSCARIAGDLLLLSQTEVGEVIDRDAGGSSTMPHKRNPVDATFAVAAARLATAAAATVLDGTPHGHERAAGAWQVEWDAVPRALAHTATAVRRLRSALESLELDREAIRRNLGLSDGAILAESLALALTPQLGRVAANDLVAELARRAADGRRHLLDVAVDDTRVSDVLDERTLDDLRDPGRYLGATSMLIDRALEGWRSVEP